MQMNKQALVSVVIPCYNHEQFVQDSIQSIINQTYQNIELIIIDDGSKDKSVEKIQEMLELCEERFIRFKFISRRNRGISATLNEAIQWAEGDYWASCSSDDFYHNKKIEKQITSMRDRNIALCVSKSYVVDDLNNILIQQTKLYNKGLDEKITFNNIFLFRVHLPVSGLFDLKILRDKLHGFDENITAEDYDLYLRLLENNNVQVLDEKLYYYRSPAAIGRQRKRSAMRLDVSNSHKVTIDKFKHHKLYKEALLYWNYRRLIYFSSYTQTKKYAIYGGINSIVKFDFYYFKAVIRILLCWKKYYG